MSLDQTTPAAEDTKTSWANTVLYGVITVGGIVLIGLKILALLGQGSLPGCTSSRTLDTVRSMLKDRNVASPAFSEMVETGSDHTEILCRAVMTSDGIRHELTYRSYKAENGQVMIAASWKPM